MTKQNETRNFLRVKTYYHNDNEATDELPVGLGQAIVDDGVFSLADDAVIIDISGLTDGEKCTIHVGSKRGKHDLGRYPKIASNGSIEMKKLELIQLIGLGNFFSFKNGVVIGISGPGFEGIKHIATYRPSNIYNHQDLQAMRVDLNRNYELKRNIKFSPPKDKELSNFEAIGTRDKPFGGSLNGTGHKITGIQIESTNDYQGLFGVIEASAVETVIVQSLVLKYFKITGNDFVGSLVGLMKRGTVDDVRVRISDNAIGNSNLGDLMKKNHGAVLGNATGFVKGINYVGGLVGYSSETSIVRSDAMMLVIGSGDNVGGLVGKNSGSGRVRGDVAGYVIGVNNVGGLVGENYGDVLGNVTGDVIGSGDNVGGLVGKNSDAGSVRGDVAGDVKGVNNVGGLAGENSRTVTGSYVMGTVTATGNNVGGLVGSNHFGAVSGCVMGDVTGANNAGGLAGFNTYTGFVRGYAIGVVTGVNNVGGLVGENGDTGIVKGYARSVVRRASGEAHAFGKTIGIDIGKNTITCNSKTESKLYDGEVDATELTDTNGQDGIVVTIANATRKMFEGYGFVFGAELGEWIWVEDGKWPAINLGETKEMRAQSLRLQYKYLS